MKNNLDLRNEIETLIKTRIILILLINLMNNNYNTKPLRAILKSMELKLKQLLTQVQVYQ